MNRNVTAHYLPAVDLFRLVAILAIISIHTAPFKESQYHQYPDLYKYFEILSNQLARFAVPFFFVISGYFWGARLKKHHDPLATATHVASKLLVLFFIWSGVYLIYRLTVGHPDPILTQLLRAITTDAPAPGRILVPLFFQGFAPHLWFLPSLAIAVLLAGVLLRIGQSRILVAISLVLYVIGVLAKSYANSPIGFDIGFDTRDGPFFSALPFLIGYALSLHPPKRRWFLPSLMFLLLAAILQLAESFILWRFWEIYPEHDYVFSTVLLGVFAATAALSWHLSLKSHYLFLAGNLTLGMYTVHYIYIDLLRPIDRLLHTPLWDLAHLLLVYVFSFLSALILYRIRPLRFLVAGSRPSPIPPPWSGRTD